MKSNLIVPIPDRLNAFLVLTVQAVLLGALWLASRTGWMYAVPIGIAASFVFLTNYALLHEACHGGLRKDTGANRRFGWLAGMLFPVSFEFLRIAHKVHHNNNRTDHEMFDYYYPHDNLLLKRAQWYSILTGIYPPIIPVGSALMAIAPRVFDMRPFAKAKSSSVLFANRQYLPDDVARIRWEVAAGIAYWAAAWYLLSLQWLPVLVVYGCCWFNWSTRQYVTHAFTPRNVVSGAMNLKVSRLHSLFLLRGEWDQVHHKYPEVPWIGLPGFSGETMPPYSFARQYLSLWKGPRPNPEPAPRPLA